MKYVLALIFLSISPVWAKEYHLDIAARDVNITGTNVTKITINNTIPGPILYFQEGEEAIISVTNHLKEDTSIHWHGLLLPGEMDGVPGFNGFPGIKPGQTFTYRFLLRQSGTYWYHAHSLGQEQEGHYGAIVVKPKHETETPVDRDYIVLLSDFTEEHSQNILSHLKMSSDYYQYARSTLGDFFHNIEEKGFKAAWNQVKLWGNMRMLPTDLSDVTGYTYLINGKTPNQNWTGMFQVGEKIRLRFINASAMSFYDVRIPGMRMKLVAADGQNIKPIMVDEFRFGVAETYDVIVEPKEHKAFTIVAEPIDRTGFALGTLAPELGMRGEIPQQRPRAVLTMADMGMSHDHHQHHQSGMSIEDIQQASGWAQAGTPVGHKQLDYADLRYIGTQQDTRLPTREILLRLGGNMERYIWTINGKTYHESGPIHLKYGERVRLKFINDTMMAHPMHLHGMFMQLENGQPLEKLPNKHTIIIPPGQSYNALLTVNEPGEWAFHCHLLYHMMAGMMNKVVVSHIMPENTSIKTEKHVH